VHMQRPAGLRATAGAPQRVMCSRGWFRPSLATRRQRIASSRFSGIP